MAANTKLSTKDLVEVFAELLPAQNKWLDLGLVLGISYIELQNIQSNNRNNRDCLRNMLILWLQSTPSSNWTDICKALRSPTVNLIALAGEIEGKITEIRRGVPDSPTEMAPSAKKLRLAEIDRSDNKQISQNQVPSTSDELQVIDEDISILTTEELGFGGSGTVFKGTYKNQPCAVKVLNHVALCFKTKLPASKLQKKSKYKFDRECMVLESFKHPNVVQHFATVMHPKSDSSVLVTELLDCNLSYYIVNHESSLTNDCEISISKDVARGLEYIHLIGVMHRDLCGANILMKISDPLPIAKIADFGMSKSFDALKSNTTLTHRPGYVLPEALDEDYDLSIDVFSCGVIMMQIVLRKENVESRRERVSFLAKINAGTHPLKPSIVVCLEKDKNKRPSAANLFSHLQLLSQGQAKTAGEILKHHDTQTTSASQSAGSSQDTSVSQEPTTVNPPPPPPIHVSGLITVADLKIQTRVIDTQLQEMCTKQHLRDIAPSVGNYRTFATRFGLPPGVLAGIDTNRLLSFTQKTEQVFLWWSQNIRNPSYLSFVETCLELGEGGVARKMCQLCATVPTRAVQTVKKQSTVFSPSVYTGTTSVSADDTLTVDHVMPLLGVLQKARDNWYFIGQGIGVSNADLEEIELRHHPNSRRCLHEILKRRIQQGGLTRSMLCQCLRGELVGRDDVAQEIEALN